jgi:hypothetical protein
MNNYKPCKQCGEIKPQAQYRKYYGGRKGSYNTCKLCEKINSREKYLSGKAANGDLSAAETTELQKIHTLWDYQSSLGLCPPRKISGKATPIDLDVMLETYHDKAQKAKSVLPVNAPAETPAELIKWLTEELVEEPEFYQDEVYYKLKETYRPQLFIDTVTHLPIYDDTYKTVLDEIAKRFDEYEDTYYDKED